MTTITIQQADTIAHACEWIDASFRRDYSGRGMYGKTCIGVTHSEATDIARLCEELRECGNGDLAKLLVRGGRQDSMGLRTITYWPNVSVEGSTNDEDEDDE